MLRRLVVASHTALRQPRGGHSLYKPSDTCVNGVILRGVLFWESCFLVPYYYVIL
jgi:hypothetical protein